MNKLAAFIKKDLILESSYRLAFLLRIFTVFTSILVYYFIDRMFGHRITSQLQPFGVNYFAYVLLGTAFFSYAGTGLGSISSRLRLEQMQGTLESVFLSPTSTPVILLSISAWNIIFATFDLVTYIFLGKIMFGVDYSNVNILSAGVILLLTIISFGSIGIISGSFILLFKRGNIVSWLMNQLQAIAGGVYFPITVLPGWLQIISGLLPMTYAVKGIQLSVYQGYSLNQIWPQILGLSLFSLALAPAGIIIFQKALNSTRITGTIGHY